jgi:hypothetical protein
MRWIPEAARRRPDRVICYAYRVPYDSPPQATDRIVEEALSARHLTARGSAENGWTVILPHRTWVYGVVRREVDEQAELRLFRAAEYWELRLVCRPLEVHGAHAAGVAGILVIAATVWIAAGLAIGLLPAVTTVLAGLLLVEITRQWAFNGLQRRLHRLVGDVGSALWPATPSRIVDCADVTRGPR